MNTIAPASAALPSAKIIELRTLLAQRFPQPLLRRTPPLSTGIPPLDHALEGGLWRGGMVEFVAEHRTSGAVSLLRRILEGPARRNGWAALIDGRDSFCPETIRPHALAQLLWLRCHSASEALECADLLLRDGNLPLVCLDLAANPDTELRRVPSQHWYRLQRMLEPVSTAFLVLTPRPLVPCADARLHLCGHFSLQTLEDEAELWRGLSLTPSRTRRRRDAEESTPFAARAG